MAPSTPGRARLQLAEEAVLEVDAKTVQIMLRVRSFERTRCSLLPPDIQCNRDSNDATEEEFLDLAVVQLREVDTMLEEMKASPASSDEDALRRGDRKFAKQVNRVISRGEESQRPDGHAAESGGVDQQAQSTLAGIVEALKDLEEERLKLTLGPLREACKVRATLSQVGVSLGQEDGELGEKSCTLLDQDRGEELLDGQRLEPACEVGLFEELDE